MNGSVTYVGGLAADTGRMPSGNLWQNCPWDQLSAGAFDGFAYWQDFISGLWTHATNTAAAASTLSDGVGFTGATAGSSIGAIATAPYGVLELANTTDGQTTILSLLGDKNTAGKVVFEADKKVWFEARIKIANVTANEHGVFCGFGQEGLAADASVITAADALADKDLVGFHKLAGGTTAIGTYYRTAGQTVGTVSATAGTIAADTWTKVGIYCDGTTVYFYQNGLKLADSVALAATTFPNEEEMAFYYALVPGSGGGDCVASIDWVKVAQER